MNKTLILALAIVALASYAYAASYPITGYEVSSSLECSGYYRYCSGGDYGCFSSLPTSASCCGCDSGTCFACDSLNCPSLYSSDFNNRKCSGVKKIATTIIIIAAVIPAVIVLGIIITVIVCVVIAAKSSSHTTVTGSAVVVTTPQPVQAAVVEEHVIYDQGPYMQPAQPQYYAQPVEQQVYVQQQPAYHQAY